MQRKRISEQQDNNLVTKSGNYDTRMFFKRISRALFLFLATFVENYPKKLFKQQYGNTL
ncbi:hypothetical protein HMPREF2531_00445 [Bacteroides intestinalis]|uniref:Uncharacterized protein n=2 Tax=Bacteroides TaxID=816 RepID=A0A139LU58_9BACE|nr:hypothetical protein BACCELL_05505 [Bacteroides cellulosilyticus DSM 14838]KXT54964.1 hypothetical protein HMPREF2531_00445 [Bacteroides intestinalis]